MNKTNFSEKLQLLLTPLVLMLLGIILVINPDVASALISKLLGWVLILIAIGFGIAAVSSSAGRFGSSLAAVSLAVLGGFLVKNPLFLADWIGRIFGLALLFNAVSDFLCAKRLEMNRGFSLVSFAIGLFLLLVPLTASRLLFTLCGAVMVLVGLGMLVYRLKKQNRLPPPQNPDIIDAL